VSDVTVDYDVIINGYGPVGEVLANLLGRDGHRVAVFERAASVYHMPRAAHFDHEAMRIFQSVGLAESILPSTCWIRGMHFLNGEGQRLFGFEQPVGPTANGWNNDYMFYQPTLEQALRAGVDRYPNVHVVLEADVDAVVDHGTHVEVTVSDVRDVGDVDHPGDRSRVVTGRYVIGCDGARSTTRRCADIELEDFGFDESWLVVDAKLIEPVDLPDVCHQRCDPVRPTTYVPMPDPYRRWEFMLLPGESVAAMEDPARIYELLEPWVSPAQAEIVRGVVYTFHAVIAHGWRRGRVIIAGDAAHQMPPFLGQGMCSGLRDAANLAWKLDVVLRGMATEDILDTYESERAPHVRSIIDAAVSFGGIICTLDRDIAAARDAQFLGASATSAMSDSGAGMTPPLGRGVLATTTSAPTADHAGRLFIQPWVTCRDGNDVLLDDVLGSTFAVIARDASLLEALDERSLRALGELRATSVVLAPHDRPAVIEAVEGVAAVAVTDRDGYLASWFDERGVDAVVLRPDRYVFGASCGAEALGALVEQLRGALVSETRPVS